MGRLIILLLLCGCDAVFGLSVAGAPDAGSQPYDRCAPVTIDDPLRTAFVPTASAASPSWADGRRACQLRGMDLAVFHDAHEMGRAASEIWPYWIGAYQLDGGSWTTVDTCATVPMPSPTTGAPKMCGAMASALDPVADSCDGVLTDPAGPPAVLGMLCETPRPQTAACLPKDPTLETYSISPQPMAYAAANQYCTDRGQHLVVVDSSEELGVLSALAQSGRAATSFWLGVTFTDSWRSVTTCPAVFSWTNEGPTFAGDVTSCAAAVVAPASDSGGPALQGMAVASCADSTKLAVCESD